MLNINSHVEYSDKPLATFSLYSLRLLTSPMAFPPINKSLICQKALKADDQTLTQTHIKSKYHSILEKLRMHIH